MKNVSAALRTAIRSSHTLHAQPRLIAEWNLNRYAGPVVTNTPSDDDAYFDQEVFPLESIVEPVRPRKGINKAIVNASRIADKYIMTNDPRFYIPGDDDHYKYWVSPFASDAQGNITGANPTVIYSRTVRANKIVVGVEDSWARPSTWSIQVTDDFGKTWRTASSAPQIGLDGRAVLYWNGSAWSSTKGDLGNETPINGVRVVVTKLGGGINAEGGPVNYTTKNAAGQKVKYSTTGARSHFSLIEISARLEKDLSEYVIDTSDNFELGEESQILPFGTITSNVGSVTLWNGDGRFSQNNNTASFKGLIEPNVKMELDFVYTIGTSKVAVRQFSMFAEKWSEGDDSQAKVDLADASKYLKETSPPPMKFEGLTASQIVFRLCDSVGFTEYIPSSSWKADYRIPVFWVDGERTVWEVFDDIATSTQTAIYFDSYGNLNVLPRERALRKADAPSWTARSNNSGNELADIISLSSDGEYQSNVIKVQYRSAEWAGDNNGHPALTSVWEPEGDVVLRSTQLIGKLSVDDSYITIAPEEAQHWPYEGHVQIEGEFIEYSGKRFKYWDASKKDFKYATVKDQKQYDELNESTPEGKRHLNKFNGNLAIVERGVWDTDIDSHVPEAKGWNGSRWSYTTDLYSNSERCHTWVKKESVMRMSHNGHLNNLGKFAFLTRGANNDTGWRTFGTRFKFNGNSGDPRAGIIFNHRGQSDAYLVEVRTTNGIPNTKRDKENEITIYSIKNGKFKKISTVVRQQDLIVADLWHDLDVTYNWGDHSITVFLDGKRIFRTVVDSAWRHAPGGKFGMFIRGKTSVDFEYMYAHARAPRETGDESTFYDRVRGAYAGDMWNREWVYKKKKWKKRKNKKRKKKVKHRKNLFFFDDFGPYVHEVREFDVSFDPAPVAQSRIMFSNDWGVVCPVYRANAFGAYFILANASRRNEVVAGDDEMTFASSGETVGQQLTVFGRNLIIEEQEEIEVRNEEMVRARGEIVAEINSDWIQSEDAAQGIADWVADHWATTSDKLNVTIFGNPLLELGDVISVDFPERQLYAATHKYFITGIDSSFEDGGIKTTLTLQRNN